MEKITVTWLGPYKLENITLHSTAYENGLYAIYRVFNNNETLLYIGKTERNLYQGLMSIIIIGYAKQEDKCLLDLELCSSMRVENTQVKSLQI